VADAKPSPGATEKDLLRHALATVTAALGAHDFAAAVAAMRAANEACVKLEGRREFLTEGERPDFEALAAGCGVALDRAGRDLQAASNQRENIRRGLSTYLKTAP